MKEKMPIVVGEHAVEEGIEFCKRRRFSKYLLVADDNTYRVLGKRVHDALLEKDWDVIPVILNPEGLHADNVALARVFAAYDGQPRMFIAVGSGTITDTARFTSHRSRNPFISFPTAASVDAYTSKNAAVTIGEMKGSVYCLAPEAVFTDIQTIVESPNFLTASGFGDLLGKFTSSSDWKYTHLIWEADFDPDIYTRTLGAALKAQENTEGIVRRDPRAMTAMMEAQFETGFCMAEFGNSAPASGGEHHIAHVWEMMFHWEGREGLYHGSAVGVSAVLEAGWYEKLRGLTKENAARLLETVPVPSSKDQEARIRETLPEIAEDLIARNPIYLRLADPAVHKKVSDKILKRWEAIQDAAACVPAAGEMRAWLEKMGGAAAGEDLGLTPQQAEIGAEFGHYLRERFSMNILRKLFGW